MHLEKNGLLSKALRQSLIAMTGFRNIAIHTYQELDKSVLRYIAEIGYKDLIGFAAQFGVRINP